MKDKIINILGTRLDADQQTLENIADEILLLFGVGNRRELLIGFLRWYTQAMGNNDCPNTAPDMVDLYIEEAN